MNITNYLKKFFVENNVEAAIPSLGVFYLEDKEGSPNPIILFKEKLPKSKAFLNFVAFEENLTEQEALDGIEEWVKGILKELKASGLVNIPDLGTFEIIDGKVEFLPSPDQFTADEIFGLESGAKSETVESESREEGEKASKQPKLKKNSKRKLRRLIILSVALILAIVAVWFLMPVINNMIRNVDSSPKEPIEITFNEPLQEELTISNEENSLNNEVLDTKTEDEIIAQTVLAEEVKKKEQIQAKPKVENPAPKSVSGKNETKRTDAKAQTQAKAQNQGTSSPSATATVAKTSAKATPIRYYIIADAFAVKENAEKRKRELNDKAYTVEILHNPQKNLYMVSVKSFDNMDDALNFKALVRDQKGIPCWIYKK